MEKKAVFNIADISLSIVGDLPKGVLSELEAYRSSSEDAADTLQINCRAKQHIAAANLECVYGTRRLIEEYGSLGENFIAQDRSGSDALALFSYSADFREVDFSLVDVEHMGGHNMADRLSVGLGKCVLNCLPAFGCITFHSSAIAYEGKAILFAAPSGTGKSTQSDLWKKYYPKETSYINDDTPIIRKKDGVFFAFGSPWAGTSGINNNISAPISAIVYVERSAENSVSLIGGKEKILRGLCSVREQVFPPQIRRQNELLFELLTEVPAYKLRCNISREAVETLKSQLF